MKKTEQIQEMANGGTVKNSLKIIFTVILAVMLANTEICGIKSAVCVILAGLDVRRIREQRQNALLAKLAEAGKVDDFAVDGRRVDLEVARVDNGAKACVDGERDRVRDGVVHVDELHAELAGLDGHAAFHRDDLRGFKKAVLFEL